MNKLYRESDTHLKAQDEVPYLAQRCRDSCDRIHVGKFYIVRKVAHRNDSTYVFNHGHDYNRMKFIFIRRKPE